MATKKKQIDSNGNQEEVKDYPRSGYIETSTQKPLQTTHTSTNVWTQGNAPHPLSLTKPSHIGTYNALNNRLLVAIGHLTMIC